MAEENSDPKNNSEETPKKPEEQLADLKKLITETKTEAQEAKRLLVLCQQYEKETEAIKKKVQESQSVIDTSKGTAVEVTKTITKTEASASASLQAIETKVKSVETNIQKMDTAFIEFEKINAKVADPVSGLASTLALSQELKGQIETAKMEADKALTKITEDLAIWATQSQEMSNAYQQFQDINKKVFDQDTGILPSFERAKKIEGEIAVLKEQYSNAKNDANKNKEDIVKLNEQAIKDSAKISETLQIVTNQALANHFDRRRKALFLPVALWAGATFTSVLVLGVIVSKLFPDGIINTLGGQNPFVYLLYRLAVTSPFLFLVFFTAHQFSKERELFERYAFKAVKAFTLDSYTTLLNRNFNKDLGDNRIRDFVLEQIQNIYEEPFSPVKNDKNSKERFKAVGSAIDKKLNATKESVEKSSKDDVEESAKVNNDPIE